MRARVFNEENNNYYISEVYGKINRPDEWYIVDDYLRKDKVVLVKYLNTNESLLNKVNIEIIDYNNLPHGGWKTLSVSRIDDINRNLSSIKMIKDIHAYDDFLKSEQRLVELLENGIVDKRDYVILDYTTKLLGWNYIESEHDIEYLMKEFDSFEDSVLKEMSYISGDYVESGYMTLKPAGGKQVRLVYNSQSADEIEIILLSPRICHLVPAEENYSSDLYEASIIIKDSMVYFYHSCVEEVIEDYNGTFFKSLGLMWRYTNPS